MEILANHWSPPLWGERSGGGGGGGGGLTTRSTIMTECIWHDKGYCNFLTNHITNLFSYWTFQQPLPIILLRPPFACMYELDSGLMIINPEEIGAPCSILTINLFLSD